MELKELKEHYKQEIANIAKESYNDEQKAIANYIIDNANKDNIDSIYTFITQRVKLGFTFDVAPEVSHNSISLCKKNDKMSFENVGGIEHKLIIGENYDALKNLLVVYANQIDVIYIDPPYNTEKTKEDGNDYKKEVKANQFVYRDKFTRTGWLNMMRERLNLAEKLLNPNGIIFISIDNNMQAYLKVLCDEIFGENNFVGTMIHRRAKGGGMADNFVNSHDYVHVYAKRIKNVDIKQHKIVQSKVIIKDGEKYIINDDLYRRKFGGKIDKSKLHRCFFYEEIEKEKGKAEKLFIDSKIKSGEYFLKPFDEKHNLVARYEKLSESYSKVFPIIEILSEEGNREIFSIFQSDIFDYPKPTRFIKFLIEISTITKPNSLILDFFAGSGTTGQAVMELNAEDGGNRKCILVTNNENNIAKGITYERLYRVVHGKGTKGEKFDWTYTKEQPYLTNNSLSVFDLEQYELKIDDYEKAKDLVKKANIVFKQLNEDYEAKDFDIYNQLSSLRPYKKEEK